MSELIAIGILFVALIAVAFFVWRKRHKITSNAQFTAATIFENFQTAEKGRAIEQVHYKEEAKKSDESGNKNL